MVTNSHIADWILDLYSNWKLYLGLYLLLIEWWKCETIWKYYTRQTRSVFSSNQILKDLSTWKLKSVKLERFAFYGTPPQLFEIILRKIVDRIGRKWTVGALARKILFFPTNETHSTRSINPMHLKQIGGNRITHRVPFALPIMMEYNSKWKNLPTFIDLASNTIEIHTKIWFNYELWVDFHFFV